MRAASWDNAAAACQQSLGIQPQLAQHVSDQLGIRLLPCLRLLWRLSLQVDLGTRHAPRRVQVAVGLAHFDPARMARQVVIAESACRLAGTDVWDAAKEVGRPRVVIALQPIMDQSLSVDIWSEFPRNPCFFDQLF